MRRSAGSATAISTSSSAWNRARRGSTWDGPPTPSTSSHQVAADWAFVVPAGTWHNVVNTGAEDVRLYTVYSPPEHPAGTVHATKAEADAAEHDH